MNTHGILGLIEPGKEADSEIFDDNIVVFFTVISGELEFSQPR
jgi:N-acetylglucosamine-6-phosphate deacetylase